MYIAMASNEDGSCFNLFSEDDSDWDANHDYRDWSSEGDLDAASIDDEIADGEITRSTDMYSKTTAHSKQTINPWANHIYAYRHRRLHVL